jgi:hypothetical protein
MTSTGVSYLVIRVNGKVRCDNDVENYKAIVNKKRMTHEWKIQKYKLRVYAEKSGKYNQVNKYEFPPPIDRVLLYGDVHIFGFQKVGTDYVPVELTPDIWKLFCDHTFQFESLRHSESADEQEIDELSLVPTNMKTKHGYLKDGFVVDDDDDEEEEDSS